MPDTSSNSTPRKAIALTLLAVGLAAFAIRLQHDGPYAMPRGGTLYAGLGCLLFGGLLLWPSIPRGLRWLSLAASPVVFFLGLYGTMAEFEETISLYARDSSGRVTQLRLWIIDREDGEWVGMPGAKAAEHALDGSKVEILRRGEVRCAIPVLHDDRETVGTIHQLKVEKYSVAQAASAIGVYPDEAPETSVALRLDPCPTD